MDLAGMGPVGMEPVGDGMVLAGMVPVGMVPVGMAPVGVLDGMVSVMAAGADMEVMETGVLEDGMDTDGEAHGVDMVTGD